MRDGSPSDEVDTLRGGTLDEARATLMPAQMPASWKRWRVPGFEEVRAPFEAPRLDLGSPNHVDGIPPPMRGIVKGVDRVVGT